MFNEWKIPKKHLSYINDYYTVKLLLNQISV